MKNSLFPVAFILLLACSAFSQNTDNLFREDKPVSTTPSANHFFPRKKYDSSFVFKYGFDTNYVRGYKERLVISLYQSQRTFEMDFTQALMADTSGISPLKYFARSKHVTGIAIGYDKIDFSLGVSTPVTEADIKKKGTTKYSDYGFSFTGHKYRLELAYRKYKGFWDQNTPNYDTNYTDSSAYFQRPALTNTVFKARFIYFFNNHRFSYSAAYYNTYRQLKSTGSFFAYSDVFYNSLIDPVGYFPSQVEYFYGNYRKFNSLQAYGLTLGGGYSLNIVLFKSLYVNGTVGLGGQFYQQNTKSADNLVNSSIFKAGITGADLRGAIGYNGKNFFICATILVDVNVFQVQKVQVKSLLTSGYFAYGYRFKYRERNWTRKMKNNKYYKML
jgi:hypothetical protein